MNLRRWPLESHRMAFGKYRSLNFLNMNLGRAQPGISKKRPPLKNFWQFRLENTKQISDNPKTYIVVL